MMLILICCLTMALCIGCGKDEDNSEKDEKKDAVVNDKDGGEEEESKLENDGSETDNEESEKDDDVVKEEDKIDSEEENKEIENDEELFVEIATIEEINEDRFVTTKKNDEYKYDVYENHIEIVEYLGNEKKVEIPSKIDGLKVSRIHGFCEHSKGDVCALEEIVISKSVISVIDDGNLFCSRVNNIVIPNTLKEIIGRGNRQGSICNTTWYKNLCDEYCVVGDGILIKCNLKDENMTHIKYPEGIKKIWAPNWKSIGLKNSDVEESIITEITIPNGCLEIYIGELDIYNKAYRNVEKINIPNSVKKISKFAFTDTKWMNDLVKNAEENYIIAGDGVLIGCISTVEPKVYEVPEGVKYIACSMAVYAKKIIFPHSLEGVGEHFVSQVDELVFNNENIQIGECAFGNLDTINVPNVVWHDKCVPTRAFMSMNEANIKLKDIVIPNGIEEIGREAFADCRKLESVIIPETCLFIREGAFSGCEQLKDIVIPKNVTYIGENAFFSCAKLESITIPESVTYIGDNAFRTKFEYIGVSEPGYKNIPEIRGVTGSYAETYAKENGINFVAIEEK